MDPRQIPDKPGQAGAGYVTLSNKLYTNENH